MFFHKKQNVAHFPKSFSENLMEEDSQAIFNSDARPNTSNMRRSGQVVTVRRKTLAGQKKQQIDEERISDLEEIPLPSTSKGGETTTKRQKRETVSIRKKPAGKRFLFDKEDDIVMTQRPASPLLTSAAAIADDDDEVNSFIKKKKAEAAARRSSSQDSQIDHLVALGAQGGFDDIIVESNLPHPQQNVDFMVAKMKKEIFKKFRENDAGKLASYTMIDLPLTNNDEADKKFVCLKLSFKMTKKMSKLLPKMEMDWTPGVYPVQAMVIVRRGFDMNPRTNITVMEIGWTAMITLHEQGKAFERHFESKISKRMFNSIDDIPLPRPVILQVNPRVSRGAQNVNDVGTQIMLSMSCLKFKQDKVPKLYFNIREHYKDKETGEWKPTKKGVCMGHKAFHNLIHSFYDVVAFLIDAHDRFRARLDQTEEDLNAELELLTLEQKQKQVYDENVLFEDDDNSQPLIETYSSDENDV